MTFNLPISVDDIPDWISPTGPSIMYYTDDPNNADTLFVPKIPPDSTKLRPYPTSVNEFIIPGKYMILPPSRGYSKLKIQNKDRNYISILTENLDAGGKSFVQICDKLWIVTESNIVKNNCLVHNIEFICNIN